jgi:UDP-N-acetylmuramoyl-tripeptide--D-alanyl-D-alanine ligase
VITLRFDTLANMTGGQLCTAEHSDRTFTGVSTDSRTIDAGQLFFAIRGERNDGHQFIDQVVSRGAAGVVAQRGYFTDKLLPADVVVVEVTDTHAAMIQLAAEYLQTTKARRLGITGSNGKTTTKEFAYRLLSACISDVYRSPGNFNNLFGIPLALFAMPTNTRYALLEMGISVPGEMARLASLIRPHLLTVTNVSPTHLEFLKTVQGVAREKLLAMKYAVPEGSLIVNTDDPVLMAEAKKVHPHPITFGIENNADYKPESIRQSNAAIVVTIEGRMFRLPLFGQYQVYNLLAAYAIARTIGCTFDGVDTESIVLDTAAMRGELIDARGITFIADCYNANPESVKAALASFARMSGGRRKVVVLGDMLELGDDAVGYHQNIGSRLATFSFDLILTVGPLSKHVVESAAASGVDVASLHHFKDAQTCAEACDGLLLTGDLVYLKGSRGIGLEAVLKRFTDRGGKA